LLPVATHGPLSKIFHVCTLGYVLPHKLFYFVKMILKMVSDPPLYKVVILDESHERILRRDLLFGHLKILRTVS
jgi:hypothetical protein